MSGHKFHAPKGIGFLYIRDGVRIEPYILGGGQQKNLRSGTLNVPGIAAIGAAAEYAYTDHKAKIEKLYNRIYSRLYYKWCRCDRRLKCQCT